MPLLFGVTLCGPFVRPARASTAYGSLNNFDVVNDTGTECHGFEIELEDINCSDITYTYDWNHYGKCKITEDLSVPGHPKTIVRWASGKNPDGTWAAYTAIPSGSIAATDGHRFTNPSLNFGGEHFGVGYRKPPTAVRYNWLVDDGRGTLVKGPEVQVSTPVFRYYPPALNAPAQVVAAIEPPPEVPVKEFGDPLWLKEIRTTSHNNGKVELRDLVSDDPDDPDEPNWRNGEPDEVEVEWQLMQTEFNKADGGANGLHEGAPEELPDGDEVVTRRYEFYKYTGPLDEETGEAKADKVGPDGIHGVSKTKEDGTVVDYTDVEIVGDFIGSQMAAVDPEAKVDLIDHLPDAEAQVAYPDRLVVVPGATPFTASLVGALPPGMNFEAAAGILSGTPQTEGEYQFGVTAEDQTGTVVSKDYTVRVAAAGEELPPAFVLETAADPAVGGTVTESATFEPGAQTEVTATPTAGYTFVNWTENGVVVGVDPLLPVEMNVNHSLTAHFEPDANVQSFTITTSASPAEAGTAEGGGSFVAGANVVVAAVAAEGFTFAGWIEDDVTASLAATYEFTAEADRLLVARFTPVEAMSWTVDTASTPVAGGVTSGGGSYSNGASVTVAAAPNAGYMFKRWLEGGNNVSSSADYTFSVTNHRTLTAKFARAYNISGTSDPAAGGIVNGGGFFEDGDSVSLQAVPARGYNFVNWTENGTNVSASSIHSVKANPDHALVAHFSLIMPEGNLADSTNGGTEIQWPSENELPGWKVEASTNLVDWVEIEDEVEDDGVRKHIRMNFDTKQRFYRTVHD